MVSLQERVRFLETTSLFAGLAPVASERIARAFTPRTFPARAYIFHQGDSGRALYLLRRGQVRLFVSGEDGRETSVILTGRPGEIFGELALIDGLPRSATALALTETGVLVIERAALRGFMHSYPQLSLNFMAILSHRVRYNTRQVDHLASLAISQRLARKLLELGHSYGVVQEAGVALEVALTQSDLASLVGATRESVNKALRTFREREMVAVRDGAFFLLDVDALRAEGGLLPPLVL